MKYIVVIEKIGDCETDITKAEYDRLMNIEGEYRRLKAEYAEAISALESLMDDETHCECHDTGVFCMLCRARAAIARAKGG